MLFYRQNLTLVNLPELQYIILSFRLVNQLRAPDKYKAINFRLEYLNRSYKIKIKYYKNSTCDIDIIFNRVYLLNTIVKILRSKIEYIFSKEILGAYTQVKADLNIFILARNLYSGNLATPRLLVQLVGLRLFNSYDIFNTRVEVLARKVNKFNQVYIRSPRLVTTSYPSLDIEDLASFIDI